MKKYILIPTLVLISCLHQSCEHEGATVVPSNQANSNSTKPYDINLVVGNYKWSRDVWYWSGFVDSTVILNDTTFPILYKSDSAVTTLNYELKLMNIDTCYNFYTKEQWSTYGAVLRYNITKKTVSLSHHTGGLGGGIIYSYKGTKIN
ncbi:MAG: hypothetical protein J0L80_12755 [Chitinophagales bacterium]|nr:hypothetical protein [Chitinophagales bacterium]